MRIRTNPLSPSSTPTETFCCAARLNELDNAALRPVPCQNTSNSRASFRTETFPPFLQKLLHSEDSGASRQVTHKMTRSPCTCRERMQPDPSQRQSMQSPSIPAIGNRKPQSPTLCVCRRRRRSGRSYLYHLFHTYDYTGTKSYSNSLQIAGKHLGRSMHRTVGVFTAINSYPGNSHRSRSGLLPDILETKTCCSHRSFRKASALQLQAATGDSRQTSCHYRLQSKTSRFVPLSSG